MGGEKWSFDKEAASWDDNPVRVGLAEDLANAISAEEILAPDMDVLDFGCGTGLLTLRLRPFVRSVTGVDSSRGMLGILEEKIENGSLNNITIRYLDLEKGDVLEGSYDLVVCSMTLHHVREIRPLLDQFHKITAPGGYLCIADLDPEDGRFHGENDSVFHLGFERAALRRALAEAGFDDIRDRTAAEVVKPVADEGMRSFSVFLITGRKRKE